MTKQKRVTRLENTLWLLNGEKLDTELDLEEQVRVFWVKKGGINMAYSRESEHHLQGNKV